MIVNRASFLAASELGFSSSSKWGRPPMRLYRNLPCTLFCTSQGGGASTILIYTIQENTIHPSLSTYLMYSRVTYYHSLPRPIFCGHSIPRGPVCTLLTYPYITLPKVRTDKPDRQDLPEAYIKNCNTRPEYLCSLGSPKPTPHFSILFTCGGPQSRVADAGEGSSQLRNPLLLASQTPRYATLETRRPSEESARP